MNTHMIDPQVIKQFENYLPQDLHVKLITIIVLFVVAFILSRVLNKLIDQWQRVQVKRMKKTNEYRHIPEFDTKVEISQRVVGTGIYFLWLVLALLQFESVRSLGTGLLASAGVAGIVIGMAAQSTLSNIVAGLSISFSQPVRLNDSVIFQGEWGWIEEIGLMHTIIKTWDNRRIMVPNNILANTVIQNWTIKDASLLGVVMVYVDYECDVEQVRQWVKEIVQSSKHSTDKRLAVLQVVDFTEKTMVLRILSEGKDAPTTWELRCDIREKLIRKFQEHQLPLPRIRIEADPKDDYAQLNKQHKTDGH